METLKAKRRTIFGKKVKKLRNKDLLPSVIFGKGLKSIPITLELKEFKDVYAKAGGSALIDVNIEDQKPRKVLISDVEIDPVSDGFLHTNLHQVDLTKEITTKVPIEVVGQSSAVASGEGIVLSLLSEVEVTCLPQNLPSEIKVNLSKLEKIDDAIAVKDLPIDQSKIKINADPEELVLKIDYARMEEEEIAKPEEELISEVEVEKEKKEEEEAPEAKEKEAKD